MITSVRFDRLNDGQIALYEMSPATQERHNLTQVIRPAGGGFAYPDFAARDHRLAIPTFLHLNTDSVLNHILNLVEVAGTLGWTTATLVFPTREPYTIEGQPFVVCGFVLIEGGDAVADTEPVASTEQAAALAAEYLAGTQGQDLATVHASIRLALVRQMRQREESTAAWLADEPRRLAEAATRAQVAKRSKDLLLSCLSTEQCTEYETSGSFTVRTRDGQAYRVTSRHAHNVFRLSSIDGEPDMCYCIVSATYVPLPDQMLAQKLLLETDPTSFFRIANHAVLRPPQVEDVHIQ